MSKLRITQAGWEGYTGLFGIHEFKDGVSVETLSRNQKDHLSGLVHCVEVDEDGKASKTQAGAAQRLIGGSTIRAEAASPLKLASVEEIAAEIAADRLRKGQAPVKTFYTVEELQAIASKLGINGLRDVAKPWGVKDRQIDRLINSIVKAQDVYRRRLKELELERKAGKDAAAAEALAKQREKEAQIDAEARKLYDTPPTAIGPNGENIFVDHAAVAAEKAAQEAEISDAAKAAAALMLPPEFQAEQKSEAADVPAQTEVSSEQPSEPAPETSEPPPQE